MSDPIVLFLSLLAVGCQLFVIALVGMWVFDRTRLDRFRLSLSPVAIPFAFAVATVTMLGSLFMSEIKHFTPCTLCWVQRGLLYPEVLFTALLWWRRSLVWVRRVAFLFVIVDLPVSIYHYVLEWFPSIETSVCSLQTPCYLVYVREFGYLSIPLMAFTSALMVGSLLLLSGGSVKAAVAPVGKAKSTKSKSKNKS